MILTLRIENFMMFKDPMELSFEANGYIKKFENNYADTHGHKILKSSCFYGPNNVGKSSLLTAIACLKSVMSGNVFGAMLGQISNFNSPSHVIKLGMTILYNDKIYNFDFHYNEPDKQFPKGRFIYEKFSYYDEIDKQEHIIYIRSDVKGVSKFVGSASLTERMEFSVHTNIFPFANDEGIDPLLSECANELKEISDSIIYCENSAVAPYKTLEIFKDGNPKYTKFIKKLITDIDVGINDFEYEKKEHNDIYEKFLQLQPFMNSTQRDALFDQCSLYSTHGDKKVESIVYDSRGTKELIALAGLIVDALYNDKTLIVDEFDDGLHYKIMREIVTLFNNSYNKGAQLIFALQNTNLMDTKTLFRKDQIWLLDREKPTKKNKEPIISVYRLDEFKSLGDGVRSETDILSKYEEGKLGAIPSPNLYGLTKAISESKYE